MITINFQNRSGYAKALADQSSGQRPLYLGPSQYGRVTSADLSVDQFLAYFATIEGYTKRKRDIDGNAVLVLITDNGMSEISPEDLLQGIAAGHLGDEAKAKAVAYIAQREEAAKLLKAWEQERRAMLTGAALRATI